jgi:hypothetical protein
MKKIVGQSMFAVAVLGGLLFFGFAMIWAYAIGGPLGAFVAFVVAPVTVPVFLVVCVLSGSWALLALAAGTIVGGVVGGGMGDAD